MSRSLLKLYKHEIFPSYQVQQMQMTTGDEWKLYAEQAIASGGVAAFGTIIINGSGGSAPLPVIGTRVPSYVAYGANEAIASVAYDIAARWALKMGIVGGWQELVMKAAVTGGWMYYNYGQLEDAVIGLLSKLAGDRITRDNRASAGPLM